MRNRRLNCLGVIEVYIGYLRCIRFDGPLLKQQKAYINQVSAPLSTRGNYGDIVAHYFDGDIQEGTHRCVFLDRSTFETWGKKPLPENKHQVVNGYANSWFITPEDSAGKSDYEIIIEFWPQRLFYVGLVISGIAFLSCVFLGFYFYRRKTPPCRTL